MSAPQPPADPLAGIPNIEEPTDNKRQFNAMEELAMIKAGYYATRASLDLNFEQTVGQLYAQLLERNQINSVLQKENVDLKKEIAKLKAEINKIKAVN